MYKYDIVILTDTRYVNPVKIDWYVQNILTEDNLVKESLEKRGFRVWRTNWDNPDFDWSLTKIALFRTTWDYFEKFIKFSEWLEKVNNQTRLINPFSIIKWNMNKHYLIDLKEKGVNSTPTRYIKPAESISLKEIIADTRWDNIIIKPAISAIAKNTYRINSKNFEEYEGIFKGLISERAMLIQPFQNNIVKGEVSFVVFGGKYSHTVLKMPKDGDFRVQDDFGGTVHEYTPNDEEIKFAEKAVSACDTLPVYSRVDVIRDNNNRLCVSELELIEPELWFRRNYQATELFCDALIRSL